MSAHLLCPLVAILLLLLLLAVPNIRLVYQVFLSFFLSLDFMAALYMKKYCKYRWLIFFIQISMRKTRVGLIDRSLALCLVTSGADLRERK